MRRFQRLLVGNDLKAMGVAGHGEKAVVTLRRICRRCRESGAGVGWALRRI